MFLVGRPHGDFHVLTQSREKFHEASNGKVARAISHQQRDLRLPRAENFGDLNLCHAAVLDRKSTRLNSSHPSSSYAVFLLKKKTHAKIVCSRSGPMEMM